LHKNAELESFPNTQKHDLALILKAESYAKLTAYCPRPTGSL